MSTIDISIAEPNLLPDAGAVPQVKRPGTSPRAESDFYVGSVKIESRSAPVATGHPARLAHWAPQRQERRAQMRPQRPAD